MGHIALILCHKHPFSARMRFVCFGNTVLAVRQKVAVDSRQVALHPGSLLAAAAERLGLPIDSLRLEPDFCERLLVPGGTTQVWLGQFAATDPPLEAIEAAAARFVSLPDIPGLGLPDTERDLLRLVYEHLLG